MFRLQKNKEQWITAVGRCFDFVACTVRRVVLLGECGLAYLDVQKSVRACWRESVVSESELFWRR